MDKDQVKPDNLLSLKEAAQVVGLSVRTLMSAIKNEEIRTYRIRGHKITPEELKFWLLKRSQKKNQKKKEKI